jgi:hypothetical protein
VRDHSLQEAASSDEYTGVISSSGEKITSYRLHSKPRKRWWVLAASIAAVLFFMLGHFTTLLVPQFGLPVSTTKSHITAPPSYINPSAPTAPPIFYEDSPYALNTIDDAVIIQDELAAGLRLPPDQLIKQMKQHGSLAALAVVQGVSATQLKAIEFTAAQDAFNAVIDPSLVTGPQANDFIQHLQNDQLFLTSVLDNALAICANDYCTTTGS